MDLILFLILAGLVLFIFRKFSSFIYFIAIVEIFLRVVTYFKITFTKGAIFTFLNTYIPANIPTIMDTYADGLLLDVFIFMFVLGFIVFETYLVKSLFKKI